jgi:hypothetical protein
VETAYVSEAVACRFGLVLNERLFQPAGKSELRVGRLLEDSSVTLASVHAELASKRGVGVFEHWFLAGTVWDAAHSDFLLGVKRDNVSRSNTLELFRHAYGGFTPECLDLFYSMVMMTPFMYARVGQMRHAKQMILLGFDLFRALDRHDLKLRLSEDTADLGGRPRPFKISDWYPPYFQNESGSTPIPDIGHN